MSDPNDILAEARRAAAAQEAERQARYDRLVEDTANGKTTPAQVNAELMALGRSMDVFAADVQRKGLRQQLWAQLVAARKAEVEAEDARQKLQTAEAKFEAMKREYELGHLAPLQTELDRLKWVQIEGREAARRLTETAPQWKRDLATELARDRDQVVIEVERLRQSVADWERADPQYHPNAAQRLARVRQDLAEAEKRLAELRRATAKADAAVLEA